MLHLLHNYIVRMNPTTYVAYLHADKIKPGECVSSYFKRINGHIFEMFCLNVYSVVVLVDRAQNAFDDRCFWRGFVKGVQGRLRFVIFTSYGVPVTVKSWSQISFPINVPPEYCFGLDTDYRTRPGLALSKMELKEMVGNRFCGQVCDSVRKLSSGHVGIARAMLTYLNQEFGLAYQGSELQIEVALRSMKQIEHTCQMCGGIPTGAAIDDMISTNHLSVSVVNDSSEKIAFGERVVLSELGRDPEVNQAVTYLTQYGFLNADQSQQLQFAFLMHRDIWLSTKQTKCVDRSLVGGTQIDIVKACMRKLSSTQLQHIVSGQFTNMAHKFKMALYRVVASCLPRNKGAVSPEWCRTSSEGYADLVIFGTAPTKLWFWDVLLNNDDAVALRERSKRLLSYCGDATRVIIDIRRSRDTPVSQDGLIQVSFDGTFKRARIVTPQNDHIIELSTEAVSVGDHFLDRKG